MGAGEILHMEEGAMGWKKVVGKWGWIGLIALLVACQPTPKSGGFVVLLCRSVMKAEVQHES